MFKYISYNIRNLENIKIAKTINQIDIEESLSYIPGTSLRGAYIYEYMKAKGVDDISQSPHREILLTGGIKFLNAYPCQEGKRSIALPKAYFAKKDDMRTFEENLPIELGLDRSLEMGYQKMRLSEFVRPEGDKLYSCPVGKGENLHIKKEKEGDNILFRYEYIEKGQDFKGLVRLREDLLDDFIKLFDKKKLYLGGSKGSGYGLCYIDGLQVFDSNPEIEKDREFGEEIYLLALSDILYRNEQGLYSTKIDEEGLGKRLGLDLSYIDSSIDKLNISNFNNTWNARTANIVGIGKGSIFKYRINNLEDLDLEKIKALEDQGLGDRLEDGFGRFVILDSLDYKSFVKKEREERERKEETRMSKEEEKDLERIMKEIFFNRLEARKSKEVLELGEKFKTSSNISESQLGSWDTFFSNLLYLDSKTGKDTYKSYMDHIKEKRGPSFYQLKRIRGEEDFIEFLDKYVERSDSLEEFLMDKGELLKGIEEAREQIDREDVYQYNLGLIKDYFRLEINKRKGDK